MKPEEILEGGCLCGAIRYSVQLPIVDSGYCHCKTCRRASGAPVVAWLSVPPAQLTLVKGAPRRFHSSARGQRDFCPDCGAQLFFRGEHAELVDITNASLDDPDRVTPEYHIWRKSRIAWFDTADSLPRHDDSGPDWEP